MTDNITFVGVGVAGPSAADAARKDLHLDPGTSDVDAIRAAVAGQVDTAVSDELDPVIANAVTVTTEAQAVVDAQATNMALIATAQTNTAADRVQTGLDRTATGFDAAQTAQDRYATSNDRTAVAADKATTGGYKDLAQAAASSASNDAAAAYTALGTYPDTTTGLAAVAEGAYFLVAGTGTVFVTRYRKVGGVATGAIDYASKAALDAQAASIAIDPARDDLMHTVRTTSGKVLASFRKSIGWTFAIAINAASMTTAALTATVATITNLTVSGTFTTSGPITATRLDITGGSVVTGAIGKAIRLITVSGKVIWDVGTDGVARFSAITASAFSSVTATITTLTATTLNAVSATIGNLTTTGTFTTSGNLTFSGGTLQLGVAGKVFRFVTASGKVTMQLTTAGNLQGDRLTFNRIFTPAGEVLPSGPAKPVVTVTDAMVAFCNANLPSHAAGTEAPCVITNNMTNYGWIYTSQAASMAVIERGDATKRVFAIWYGQNTEPGSGAVTATSLSFAIMTYCDDFFVAGVINPAPTWHKFMSIIPVNVHGDEATGDPQLFALPDGRLYVSYCTQSHTGRSRLSYAFLIANPDTIQGSFQIGRQYVLGAGVGGQPEMFGTKVRYSLDNWFVAQQYSELMFPGYDQIVSSLISNVPRPNSATETFYESTVSPANTGVRIYYRTTVGYYSRYSSDGLNWGSEQAFTDFATPSSRACFKRDPVSGDYLGAFNNDATNHRTNLTLARSTVDGAPGTFAQSLNIEPDPGAMLSVSSQYPTLTFDRDGGLYCIYRYANSDVSGSEEIRIGYLARELLATGTAILSNVSKVTVFRMTPLP